MNGDILDEAALWMDRSDNVATALDDLEAGREFRVAGRTVTLSEDIEFGHKLALRTIEEGDEVTKYGEVIGQATRRIGGGEWVHTHNCESTRGRGDLTATESEGGERA